jgi:O-antigen/teichoic acid export membrane protein
MLKKINRNPYFCFSIMVFKNILHTAGTRIFNALFNLTALLLITNLIGSRGLGIISLVVLDITIIQLAMGLIAGGSLIYFASRSQTTVLMLTSYIWIIGITLLFAAAGRVISFLFPGLYSDIVPAGYAMDILWLALLNGFMQIHYNLLIGQKRIGVYNLVFVLQIGLFLLAFVGWLTVKNLHSPEAYFRALYLSWGTGSILAFFLVAKEIRRFSIKGWRTDLKAVLKYGLPTQSAVTLHIVNKRLSFYFIRIFSGLPALGIYSAAVQLVEGLRLIGQSISLVQYSAISNSRDRNYARTLSIRLMKFTLILTLAALAILLIIPENLYHVAFSKDFTAIKTIIWILSPGVLALAGNTIFSHYFSGTGQPAVNLRANIIGLVFTVAFAILLIPPYGYLGAAVTASVNYLANVLYQYIIFRRQTHTALSEWMLRKNDIRDFRILLGKTRNKSN